jgi:enoyl-CoA hydratase/carnithine racemase
MGPNDAVLTETLADHIVLVTINRPTARNAINGDVAQSLAKVVEQTEQDPGV